MMPAIMINYQDTLKKADRLQQLALDIESVSNHDIADTVNFCNVVWKGSACQEYQKKLNQIGEKVKKRAGDLGRTANAVERAARSYKYLEEMAQTLFS